MPRHPGGQELRLTLRVQPADVPWPNRVRSLLKFAGRALGLKCLRVEDMTPTASQTLSGDTATADGSAGGEGAEGD